MARIRTIKPEFFTSESVCALTPLARLFFISLWCEADREGRLSWKPKTLKIRYLPLDKVDIAKLGDELINGGMIEIYQVDGEDYCWIPGFTHHQVINNRESQSVLPAPEGARRFDASPRVTGEGRKEGKEGKGKEGATTPPPAKLDYSSWPEMPSEQVMKDWQELRKQQKAKISQTVISRFGKQLTIALQAGYTVDDCLGKCIEKGWRGFEASWMSGTPASQVVQQSAPRSKEFKRGW